MRNEKLQSHTVVLLFIYPLSCIEKWNNFCKICVHFVVFYGLFNDNDLCSLTITWMINMQVIRKNLNVSKNQILIWKGDLIKQIEQIISKTLNTKIWFSKEFVYYFFTINFLNKPIEFENILFYSERNNCY